VHPGAMLARPVDKSRKKLTSPLNDCGSVSLPLIDR
jgi:hypothetical protein